MHRTPINLKQKLALFTEHWSPKIIAQMNDHQFKLVKFEGEFVWHSHADTDEVFLVIDGTMTLHLRGGDIPLVAGEMFVVPKGMEHRTSARSECRAMIIEAAGTVNTGEVVGDQTAPADAWI